MKKICLSFLFLLAAGVIVTISSGDAAETNAEPQPVQAAAAPPVANFPEIGELRQQLSAIEKSNEEATKKWEALMQQNSALSNVLTGLQETLVNQRQREVEMAKQSSAFNLRVIAGAALAVFVVLLLSYWFQLRCLNRVMEISHVQLPPHSPALLEDANAQSSKLLTAMKMLENRIHQLEAPANTASANGVSAEIVSLHGGTMSGNVLHPGPQEPLPVTPSNISLLLGKGQMLLDVERLQEAVNCFQEALALEPGNAEAHFKKGIALERMNRLEPALASYEEALHLNPRRAIAYAYKARVLAALHRYDEAISVYDSALNKNGPKAAPAMFTS